MTATASLAGWSLDMAIIVGVPAALWLLTVAGGWLVARLRDFEIDVARGRPQGLKTWNGPVLEHRAEPNRPTEEKDR